MKMADARQLVGPIYLLISLLIGGSVQSVWLNAMLQLIAIVMIAWAVLDKIAEPVNRHANQLLLLSAALVLLVVLHLVPLPALIWNDLPGHRPIALAFQELGLHPSWQPLSLAPYDTVTAGLTLLPPMAMLVVIVHLRAYSQTGLMAAMLLGALLGEGLGMLQLGSGTERFYLQVEHNAGTASGFFANPNHMATLILTCIPYLAAIIKGQIDESSRPTRRKSGIIVACGAGIIIAIFSLILNRSGAGLGLAVPVVLLSAMIVTEPSPIVGRLMFAAAALSGFALVSTLAVPIGRGVPAGIANSVRTRQEFLATGLKVARDYLPLGSGIGTFESVYRMRENVETLDLSAYVNHAHDDYLEILIEAGIPGLLLVVLFFIWFTRNCLRVARRAQRDPFALAGGIAAGTIMLHSVVDYPLRTSALSVLFAVSLAMIIRSTNEQYARRSIRPARHVEIGS